MDRSSALELVNTYIANEKMRQHCYASEAVMRALAQRLNRDEDQWGFAGLLHDLDVEKVNADLSVHGLEAAKILQEKGVDPEIIDAIVMHNETASCKPRQLDFHFALAAGETLTGLIMATALVYPDRRLASVKPKSVVKRMKEKNFAASVNRDIILECEKLGISLQEFVELSLKAMQEISDRLGL